MIGQLTGTLLEKNPPDILIDCHGVGYEVQVPMSTFYQLPHCGQSVRLLTHLIVREDAHLLYGFATAQERRAFRALVKVSGVGPRIALSVLSALDAAQLAQAVRLQEAARLVKVPGIGKKTAERLLLELRGKLGDVELLTPVAASAAARRRTSPGSAEEAGMAGADTDDAQVRRIRDDILQALLALGYSEREALAALAALPEGVSVSDGIRQALQSLG